MSPRSLPKKPDRLFIEDVLVPDWEPDNVRGFDASVKDPARESFIPIATSIDRVGEIYPSLIVSWSNESAGGATTYEYMDDGNPGQQRSGLLIAAARAEEEETYVGDSNNYSAVDAERIIFEILNEVENICMDNADGGSTDWYYIGSSPSSQPDDTMGEGETVAMDQVTVSYAWLRS